MKEWTGIERKYTSLAKGRFNSYYLYKMFDNHSVKDAMSIKSCGSGSRMTESGSDDSFKETRSGYYLKYLPPLFFSLYIVALNSEGKQINVNV